MTEPTDRPTAVTAPRDRFNLPGGPGGPPEPRTGPSTRTMVLRGAIGHCPRCGSGHLFRHWFRMVDRCPGCGHRFERRPETAFFLGAYMLNLVASLGLLAASMFVLIAHEAGAGIAAWIPWTLGLFAATLLPLISYPYSKTLWSGIEMAMHPLDLSEETEAALFLEGR